VEDASPGRAYYGFCSVALGYRPGGRRVSAGHALEDAVHGEQEPELSVSPCPSTVVQRYASSEQGLDAQDAGELGQ